jgi:hypothetical protein
MAVISIITPVEPQDGLDERLENTYESLTMQSLDTWQWVIVRIGAVTIPKKIRSDERVKVVNTPTSVAAQGPAACAHFGCEQSSGDYLLDLDVGDRLAHKAIAQFLASDEVNVDAAYCDIASLPQSGPPMGYAAQYGWQKYDVIEGPDVVTAIRSFDLSASTMSHGSYAPTYGVLWQRDRYFALGGRRVDLGTAAAYDLICRAYLAKAIILHLDACLVFSRHHTFRRDIDVEERVSNHYRNDIIIEWSRREGLRMFDLGAAHNPTPGFESIDLDGADINCDIRFGLPVEDNSVGCIRAYDFLEHIGHCTDSTCIHGADGVSPRCCVGVMNEFYRVLAPGGWIVSRTPSSDGRGAFQDPTHVSYWNPNSFWYYTRSEQARFVPGIECRFQAAQVWQAYPDEWHEQNDVLYVHAELVALKGQHQPGICEI